MTLQRSGRGWLQAHTVCVGWRTRSSAVVALLAAFMVTASIGCTTAAKVGVELVGAAVHTVDADAQSKKLLGQPVLAADANLGPRVNTFEDPRTRREIMTYKVQGDALDLYRWVVEAQGNRIVAVSKAQFNADMGKDLIKKALLKDKVVGKTPQEIQTHSTFQKLILIVRNRSTGTLVRVYDVRGIIDLMGARYCVVEFDRSDRGASLRLVGVPASEGASAISG